MSIKGCIFEVGDLVRGKQGAKVVFDIEQSIEDVFSDEEKPISPLHATITFMKIAEGIHVLIEHMHATFPFVCNKCRKEYAYEINANNVDRVFFFEEDDDQEDIFDRYRVDLKTMTIDVTELIRQEMILHFPTIPVCSKSCKGLCPVCGADLNDTSCNCINQRVTGKKPLAILKTLYNAKTSGSEEKNR